MIDWEANPSIPLAKLCAKILTIGRRGLETRNRNELLLRVS